MLCHWALAFEFPLLSGSPDGAPFALARPIARSPLILLWNPDLGVAVFFVLSGFVLSASLARHPAPLADLIPRRWVRLALPILGTSLLIWLIAAAHGFRNTAVHAVNQRDWLRDPYAFLAWAPNDLGTVVFQSLVDVFARARAFYNPALWTMPIEFWGSLGLFALDRLLRDARPALRIAVACVTLALLIRTPYAGFPVGAALFDLTRWRAAPLPRAAAWALGGVLLILAVLLGGCPFDVLGTAYERPHVLLSRLVANPTLAAHRAGAAAFVAAALILPPWRALLAGRVCRHLGRISFSLYLMHVPLLCSFGCWVVLRALPLGYHRAVLIAFLANGPVLLAVAELCTRAFDRPSLRLSRQVGRACARAMASPSRLYRA